MELDLVAIGDPTIDTCLQLGRPLPVAVAWGMVQASSVVVVLGPRLA